jgi:hypothetical protein
MREIYFALTGLGAFSEVENGLRDTGITQQSEAPNFHRLISEKAHDNNELIYCVFTPSCLVEHSNTPLYVKLVIDPKATVMYTADLRCRHCAGHPDDSTRI